MGKTITCIVSLAAGLALLGCDETAGTAPQQVFFNGPDLVTASDNIEYVRRARYTGRLSITTKQLNDGPESSRHCTATFIGDGFFVTAAHCFDGRVVAAAIESNFLSTTTATRSRVDLESIERLTPRHDVAVGRVFGDNYPTSATISFSQTFVGDELFVLHHPDGRPLSVTDKNCTITDAGDSRFLNHRCDTEQASSGALLVSKRTGAVVGVHVEGPTTPSDVGQNIAERMTAVVASNRNLRSRLTRVEASGNQPLTEEQARLAQQAVFGTPAATEAVSAENPQTNSFIDGRWVGLGRPNIFDSAEIARKYCSDTLGTSSCGRHGDWSIVSPPVHDPSNVGVRVCGRNGERYQLTVTDRRNFSYVLLGPGPLDPELARQTREFGDSLATFNRTDTGDRLLTLVQAEC